MIVRVVFRDPIYRRPTYLLFSGVYDIHTTSEYVQLIEGNFWSQQTMATFRAEDVITAYALTEEEERALSSN